MTVNLTTAEARRLGIDLTGAKAAKVKTTRRTVKGVPYYSKCKACGFESRTTAAENRHLDEHPDHNRYEILEGL